MNGRHGGFVAKRASKSTRVTAAKRSGRTNGRTAKRSANLRAAPKKVIPQKTIPKKPIPTTVPPLEAIPEKAVPAEVTAETGRNRDSAAKATQTTLRKSWKGQQQDAAALAKTQHGAIIDARAHVRATTGHRWTARKTH